jgi:hypothetical protein
MNDLLSFAIPDNGNTKLETLQSEAVIGTGIKKRLKVMHDSVLPFGHPECSEGYQSPFHSIRCFAALSITKESEC